jgi:hypothetical protein
MFGSTTGNEITFLWSDRKIHKIKIKTDAGDEMSLDIVRDQYEKIMETKTDGCKDIFYLGIGLLGDRDAAYGFLLGWIVRSIKESSQKQWIINHEANDISEDEANEMVATELVTLAEQIRKGDKAIDKRPVLRGDSDGADRFL